MRNALLLVALTAAGCGPGGPPLHPVTGTVTFADGRPVPGAMVEFVAADGSAARGRCGPDGAFALATGDRPGAAAGAYRVAVVQMAVADGAAGHATLKHAKASVHPRYARLDTSGLAREVKPGPNHFPLAVDPAGPAAGGW